MPRSTFLASAVIALLVVALAVLLGPALTGSVALAATRIPHTIEGRSDCLMCHGADKSQPVPADHKGRANETCLKCHAAASSAPIPSSEPSPTSVVAGSSTPEASSSGAETSAGDKSLSSGDCLGCHGVRGAETTLASGEKLLAYVDPAGLAVSPHSDLPCQSCHTDKTAYPHGAPTARDWRAYTVGASAVCGNCHAPSAETWSSSVHGSSVSQGNEGSATCADCHLPHKNQPVVQAGKSIVCSSCHGSITQSYEASVHGQLAVTGRTDAATCLSCHSADGTAHALKSAKQPDSPTARHNVAANCGQCHPDSQETYDATMHGRAMLLGVNNFAPTCVDCHGAYGVRPVHAAEKPLDNATIAETCAQCHKGADANFAAGWMGHEEASPTWFPAVYVTERFLFFLTAGAVAFGVVHVELDVLRSFVNRRKRRKDGTDDADH